VSEGLYVFFLDRALAEELWKIFEQTTADLITFPGAQQWWTTRKLWHTAKFLVLVDPISAPDVGLAGSGDASAAAVA
jgi:hypothetical protein